ncbi:MAG: hypothetical protein DME07_16800 [Candidatus Rokuibacteriota bacterium]|nr:MAG: hypothetical protein DME07_16800 [Candidatus Rokubacteria bacterium]PYN57652.1 MAG: hypothetical protein DMD94_03585 [Candidatus Rokubacteria bacterium]
MVRWAPASHSILGRRGASRGRGAHRAPGGGRRAVDRRGRERARPARSGLRWPHAAGCADGAPRRPSASGELAVVGDVGRARRSRDADLRHVLAGDDVRPGAAADPRRPARGQSGAGRAGPGRPPVARHGVSLPAVPHERGEGRARVSQASSAPNRLYSDVIRERWRRPRHRGDLPGANAVAEDVNPLCGDRVRLMLTVEPQGRIAAARFVGDSCAICTASADVLAELVSGRSRSDAAAVEVGDVLAVLQAEIRPTRMRCVTLPLTVLAKALNGGRGA